MFGDGDCSGNAALLLQIFAQTRTHYSTTNTTLHAYSHFYFACFGLPVPQPYST